MASSCCSGAGKSVVVACVCVCVCVRARARLHLCGFCSGEVAAGDAAVEMRRPHHTGVGRPDQVCGVLLKTTASPHREQDELRGLLAAQAARGVGGRASGCAEAGGAVKLRSQACPLRDRRTLPANPVLAAASCCSSGGRCKADWAAAPRTSTDGSQQQRCHEQRPHRL